MEKYTHDPTAPSAALPYQDGLLFPSHIWQAAKDPQVAIEPAWKVSLVYGMPCSILCILPAAYYLAARFQEDFEQAVLHAANGGGKICPERCSPTPLLQGMVLWEKTSRVETVKAPMAMISNTKKPTNVVLLEVMFFISCPFRFD